MDGDQETEEYIEVAGQAIRMPQSGVLTIGHWSIDYGNIGPDVTFGVARHCCNTSLGDCQPAPDINAPCPEDKPIVVWR